MSGIWRSQFQRVLMAPLAGAERDFDLRGQKGATFSISRGYPQRLSELEHEE